jgi:hypothetical protein
MAKTLGLEKIVSSAATRAKVVISNTDLVWISNCQPDSALAKWIQENLVPERFLSKEEVRLFQSTDRLEVYSEPGIVPLREEDLLSVIADLDAETEVLNRQASVLEAQRAIVERRDGLTRKSHGRALAAQIEERNSNEIHRLEREISGAREEIEGMLRTIGESIDRAARKIPATMTEVLNGHDRTLEALADEGLVGDIPEVVVSTDMNTVERLTASLSRMVAEELQIRLDRTYLESLCEQPNQPNNTLDLPMDEDAARLEQDLQSLYAEIPEVATIHVTQKYGDPLVRAVRQEEMQRRAVATLHSDQVTILLAGITVELEQLVQKLRTFYSYRCANRSLRAGYELSCISNKCNAQKTGKEISKPIQEHGPAMELLLRHFGISSTASRGLQDSVDEKVARMQENTRKVGQNAGFDARKALDERKLLVESLLNGTDQSDEESILKLDDLDAKINRLREDVETVSRADTGQAVERQKAFADKWS